MKTTPFQLALKKELVRLERLSSEYVQGNHSLVSCAQRKPVRQGNFLLQLLGKRIFPRVSMHSNLRISY